MKKVLVTSYENPDLDGTACSVGYAEYLQKQGKDAVAGVFGSLHRETEFVLQAGNIPSPVSAEELINNNTEIILVDASDTTGIAKQINLQKVIEVIDHRKIHFASEFINAKIQIELVGSAATLIAEKYFDKDVAISKESALLLYAAIVSNTINFQATVTTDRDKKMAEWLKTKCEIPENFAHDMFVAKSRFIEPLEAVFEHDFSLIPLNDNKLGIVQLEIVEADNFIEQNMAEIQRILLRIREEKTLDMILLTIIDVEKATNDFIATDPITQQLMQRALDVIFIGDRSHREGILMRKQITPLLKETIGKV